MIDFVIPILLLCGAAAIVMLLGTVEPEERPAADTTRAGRLRSLRRKMQQEKELLPTPAVGPARRYLRLQ